MALQLPAVPQGDPQLHSRASVWGLRLHCVQIKAQWKPRRGLSTSAVQAGAAAVLPCLAQGSWT